MNILLATLVFPFPINDGGKSGTYRMVESLRENHSITFICPESNEENLISLRKLWPNVNIKTFKQCPSPAKENPFIGLVKTITGRKLKLTQDQVMVMEMQLTSSTLENYFFENLIDIFQAEILTDTYNLVQIDFIDLAPLVHFIPSHIPKVFVHHEIRYKRMEREKNTLREPLPAHDWKIFNTKLLEIGLINNFDKVICLTEIDKKILQEDGVSPEKLEVSPLPMILNNHEINKPFVSQKKLLFLGPDQHYPNLDGINWFLSKAWKEIQRLNPGVKLSIVGKWSKEKQNWFSNYEDVTFEGFVKDLETVLEGAIMIVPLRIGSGMRMKILEGVSYNVPIVSTYIGAEGLPMTNDENCKIADTPEDFILAVHQLLNNEELQNKFIFKASQILSNGYSSSECAQKRDSIYNKLIN